MLSTSNLRPRDKTACEISATGFRMPDEVSQWMAMTWLMAGSASSAAATSSPRGGM